nr:PAC2 family protein [Candidatus Njordarchaeum guaymaensis]
MGYFDQHYVPSLSKPVMIIGLRSNTDLGYLCAKRLAKTLGAKRFAEYYSEFFPDLAFVDNSGLCRLPRWVLHESSKAIPNMVILSGVAGVMSEDPEAYYSTFDELMRFSRSLGIRVAYVLDGTVSAEGEENNIQVAATDPKLVRKAHRHGAKVLKEVALSPTPSMFLGLSRFHDLAAMLILGSLAEPESDDAAVANLLSFLYKVAEIKV